MWLYDPERHAAGLVHAGWRGTRADIAAKTARKMCAEFGSALEDLLAFIGPGISRCCFEVAAEVAEEFAAMLGTEVFYGENGRDVYKRQLYNIVQVFSHSGRANPQKLRFGIP